MTQRVLTYIHTGLANRRYWELRQMYGPVGDHALRAFAETAGEARRIYYALPSWRRGNRMRR